MKPTLGQVLAMSLVGLAATLGLLFAFVLNESRATIVESSDRIRDQASREISERVTSFLRKAPDTVGVFQRHIKLGPVDPADPKAVDPRCLNCCWPRRMSAKSRSLMENRQASMPMARSSSPQCPDGKSVSFGQSMRRVTSYCGAGTSSGSSGFVADRRTLEPAVAPPLVHRERSSNVSDPTAHLTFTTPASRDFYGQLLWSDLHWSQLDADQAQLESK